MRTGSSDIRSQGNSGRIRLDGRLKRARKSRSYRIDLEGLESRTLLATIPAASVVAGTSPVSLSNLTSNGGPNANESSPLVEVDPLDPQKIVAVWVNSDPVDIVAPSPQVFVQGVYSINGGATWTSFYEQNEAFLFDPNTTDPTVPYLQLTNPSLAFDRSGNFYVLVDEHNSGGTSGALVLQKFNFASSAPVVQRFKEVDGTSNDYNIIDQWLPAGDFAVDPTMAVDDNVASFTDPTTGEVQTDLSSGNIYIAWSGTIVPPAGNPLGTNFNPSPIVMTVSSDGGQTFSAPSTINNSGYGPTTERDATPQIVISQGRLADESGQGGDAGIPGGQVTVGWVNYGANQDQLMANTVSPGRDYTVTSSINGEIKAGTTTAFTQTVSVPSGQIANLNALSISLAITDTNDATLGVRIIAPGGESITLFTNQTDLAGNTVANRGISGANVGVNNGFAVGTTFTDTAARSIVDINPFTGARGAGAPYVGDFKIENDFYVTDPDGRSLDAFLAKVVADGDVNGTWTLQTIDTNTTAPSTPSFLNFWSINLATGQTIDQNVFINSTYNLLLGGPTTNALTPVYPTIVPSSPISIGPGLSMASDNTLGSFSPYEGRIYMTFVGYYDVTIGGFKNPTTNTDIFLIYSDDGGRSWSEPEQVNDDNAQTDGYSGAVEDSDGAEYNGRSQYMPEVAVDPTTGTVVLSWRDARDDSANARVATYITSSIDGGQTFSAQTYANPSKTAIDAITGDTVVLGPKPDNESSGNNKTDDAYSYGTQMGLAVYDGQLYPIWSGNFNEGTIVNSAVQGPFLQIYYQPMVIAAGPRIISSTMGPIQSPYTFDGTLTKGSSTATVTSTTGLSSGLAITGTGIPSGTTISSVDSSNDTIVLSANATETGVVPLTVVLDYYDNPSSPPGSPISFSVTFDRPIDPIYPGYVPTFTAADILVYYHDTTSGDASIPLHVLSVTPITSSGVGPDDKFGYTEFTVTFDPTTRPDGTASNITNFTGTYSYAVLPDANGTQIVQPIRSYVDTPVTLPTIGPVSSKDVPLRVPTSGTGGSGTEDDITTSTITIANANYNNANITSLVVNMTLDHQRDGDLLIYLTAPNGSQTILYENADDNGVNFVNTTFSDSAPTSIDNGAAPYSNPNGYQPLQPLANLNGSEVNGTYTLTIDDYTANNIGELQNWSITVNSSTSTFGVQNGAAMDQNADGTTDENPITTPFTGTTPGDAYVVPTPQPATSVTFFGEFSTVTFTGIFSPVFNQNTLPLIVSGPVVASTSVPGGSGSDSVITNGSTSTLDVTFDRPIQVSTFTPSQILQIMGPTGSISGVQALPEDSANQAIPAATATTTGTRTSTLTVPNYNGTFNVGDIMVSVDIAGSTNANLSAVLIAPNGETVTLFATGSTSGKGFTNTIFNDAAETSIASGTAPYTGAYQPQGLLSSLTGVDASGVWKLQILNTSRTANGTLVSWSLNITPQLTVTPLNEDSTTKTATQFQIGFPLQQLSGTYTVQLAPTIEDAFGDQLDSNQNAGLAVLRDEGQNSPTTTILYPSADLPKAIPAPSAGTAGQVTSTIVVPDSFTVQGDTTSSGTAGLTVQINLTYPNDPDLSATLYYDYGTSSQVSVQLFSGVGSGSRTANFTNTVFDDLAGTPIQNGSAPFFATFNPQMPLSAFAGLNAAGTWTLVVQNSAKGTASTGSFNSWSLSFQKPLPTSGLGEPGSDDASLSFRIFTLGQTDALSSEQWTSVGPAASQGATGQVSATAIDPSDPSGNTVYVAGASGGIWKSTDFLTTNPDGPTYIPLTNFGPSSGINVNSIAVFPRNNNPSESIVIAGTGSTTGGPDDSPVSGVGFLISMDGGATWTLYDSTDNVDSSGNLLSIDSASRNRAFVGMTVNKVVVDPKLSPTGQVIIYAAMSGPNGGIYRSENTGKTWQLMLAGDATSVALDPNSGTELNPDTNTAIQGNLQIVYAGIEGQGVYLSPNQGQVWNLMTGGIGNPLIVDTYSAGLLNVNPLTNPNPNGAEGRIVLAVPAPTGDAVQDAIYEGWLYAAVSTPTGGFDGLFVTKDYGANWTKVSLNTYAAVTNIQQAVPNNDVTQPQYAVTLNTNGNAYLSLVTDPTNPNIVYLGSYGGDNTISTTGLIRVDTTGIWDAHSLVAGSNFANDGGTVDLTSQLTGPAPINNVLDTPEFLSGDDPLASYLNFIRNPDAPFLSNATLLVYNYASFTNNGAGIKWTVFDMPSTGDISGTGYQSAIAMVDPTTGLPRLIFGNSQGVWSILDNNGVAEASIGSLATPGANRIGNLQLMQFYDGAVQPSNAAAQIADALFYGAAQDNGGPFSDPNILTNGNLQWTVPSENDISADLDSSAVNVDQQGLGTVDQYWFPNTPHDDSYYTDFFQVNGIGRTSGLLQASGGGVTPDPVNWPSGGIANFAVDPVNGSDMVISSATGAVFSTSNLGEQWFDIGAPSVFGTPGNYSTALAYGAPDPGAPEGIGNLGNFIYVGTATGQIYITQDGGGSGTSNNWINVSTGLDGSKIESIITSPTRGSHEAYAVTQKGVYEITNSIPTTANPTPKWINITNNIFNLAYTIFGQSYNPTTDSNATTYNLAQTLTSIVADWNYQIPNSATDPAGTGYHPALFVSANSGVYLSVDDGKTWALFPETTYGAVVSGGDLPHVNVTSLSLSLGNINSNTGMPNLAGPYETYSGTLTSGSSLVTGLSSTTDLEDGQVITMTGVPTGTTIVAINTVTATITLSAPATASGTENFTVNQTADPDLLYATTFGEGAFAINLAPILFPNDTALDPSSLSGTAADGTPLVTTAVPLIDGLSEVSAFGNSTRITIVDETPGDPTFGDVIGGFDPSNVAGTNIAANWTSSLGSFAIPINTGVFTSNGLKTVEVYATDDAGAVGNKVTLSFTLDVSGISPPSAPVTPTLQLVTTTPGYTNSPTPELTGTTSPNATVELYLLVGSTPTPFSPAVITTASATGSFSFTFPDMTGGMDGTFGPYSVVAQATNTVGSSGFSTPATTFTIIIGNPAAPSDFGLALGSDTGIVGDDITSDRTPDFTGQTVPGATVELFEVGSPVVYQTVTANSSGVFTIQLPFALSNGSISLYVEAIDQAGNQSTASNTLTVSIVSITADYNGDSYSDAALYSRNTVAFTGTLTTGSALVTNLSSLTGLVTGVGITGKGIPTGTTIQAVDTTSFTGTLTSGSALVTGISSTSGLFAGENVSGPGIPAGATILSVTSSTAVTLTVNATLNGAQSLTATAITLSAKATLSGAQSLTAAPGVWLVKPTTVGPVNPTPFWFTSGTAYGPSTAIPFQGDFDGDGLTDLAYYLPSSSSWYMYDSKSGSMTSFSFPAGTTNATTVPVAGYFDANAPDEPAVFTIVSGKGVWSIVSAISGLHTVTFGQTGDIPVPGNYDGLGYDQLAVYRPTTGNIYVLEPNGTTETLNLGVGSSPDLANLVPVPAAYDNIAYFHANELERTEAAVFDPKTGVYTILGPTGVYTVSSGFQKGDIPVPGDYLGDGEAQPVVFRPSTGQFIEAGGTVIATFGTGASADVPLAAPLSYRTPADPPADPPSSGSGGSTGTGTGSGTGTGTGTGTTGTGTGTTGTGTGSTGTGSGGSSGVGSTSPTPTPTPTSTPTPTPTPTKTPKKKASKPKKAAAHPKKATKPAKTKKADQKSTKPKVKIVAHPAAKTIKLTTSHADLATKPKNVVDLALESVHVNLRRSTGKKA